MVISANDLLQMTVDRDASDLHIGTERPPYMRIDGSLTPTELPLSLIHISEPTRPY